MDNSKKIQLAEANYNKLLADVYNLLKSTYEALVETGQIEYPVEPQQVNFFITSLVNILQQGANTATRLYARNEELERLEGKTEYIESNISSSKIKNFILTQIEKAQVKYPDAFGDIKQKKKFKKIDKTQIPEAFKDKLKQKIVPEVLNKLKDIDKTSYSPAEKYDLVKRVFTDQYGTLDVYEMITYLIKLKINFQKLNIPFPSYLEVLIQDGNNIIKPQEQQNQKDKKLSQPTSNITSTSNQVNLQQVFKEIEEDFKNGEMLSDDDIIYKYIGLAQSLNPTVPANILENLIRNTIPDIKTHIQGSGINQKSKNNKWIAYVKQVQQHHNCPYSQALKIAAKSYKK